MRALPGFGGIATLMPAQDHSGGSVWTSAALLLGRLLLALIFVHEGFVLLGGWRAAVVYMERFGVPGMLLPAVILLELGGGILIAVGALTRVAALAFSVFCVLTALLFHTDFADQNQLLHFQKDLGLAGGFLVLTVCGSGAWSVDRLRSRYGTRTGAREGNAARESG
jgi:putative oxidoreductase